MGVIERPDGQRFTLGTRSLIGRAAYCAVRLDDPIASAEHAAIHWDGSLWVVRDLASTNGTWVDGVRIDVGKKVEITSGSKLSFGRRSNRWTLVEASAPRVRFRRLEPPSYVVEPTGGIAVLPSEEQPLVTLCAGPDGWFADREGEGRLLKDQELLVVDSDHWRVELPPALSGVDDTGFGSSTSWAAFEQIQQLRFEVSRDREAISLALEAGSQIKRLGHRAYHELLLVLAEARLRDRAAGFDEDECGWLYSNELAKAIAADVGKVNVDVYRLRQQFDLAGILEAHRIVERRGTTRQLRIGVRQLEIVEGATLRSTPPAES